MRCHITAWRTGKFRSGPLYDLRFGDSSLYCMMGSAHVQIIASALPEFMSAVFRF